MEKRVLLGTAATGWAMVLFNWKRLLVLDVVPPLAITLRVMANRELLWAVVVSETATNRMSKSNVLGL